MQNSTVNHEQFNTLMADAANGDPNALHELYTTFLSDRFFVPERFQKKTLTLQPEYPNDFLNILGVQDSEQVYVPVFSSPTGPSEWFGEELKVGVLSGKELVEKMPPEWLIVINPESEINKDLSPWEISKLKSGPEGIKEAVQDLLPALGVEQRFSAVSNDTHSDLINHLTEIGETLKKIKRIYLIKQENLDEEGEVVSSANVVGIELLAQFGKELEEIQTYMTDSINHKVIGDIETNVVAGIDRDSLSLSIFKNFDPLFELKSESRCKLPPLVDLLTLLFLVSYSYLFWRDLSPYWFNPQWITDDAMQQVYPFHEALIPGLFAGDLITDVMKGYLAPVHYWLSYLITMLVGDPVLMSHWVMFLQIGLSCGFLFFAVKHLTGTAPAAIAVTWFLHTRPIIQRMNGGLPRGWAAPVLLAYIYFILKNNHYGVLATILIGCLLHPPATFTIAMAYGLFLLWKTFVSRSPNHKKHLLQFLVACPIYGLVTMAVISRPESVGPMVDYKTAASMPEFAWPTGRFPFVPHREVSFDLKAYAMQPFLSRLYKPAEIIEIAAPVVVVSLLLLFAILTHRKKREIIPSSLWFFLIATFIAYFAARVFAFKLYVPNRHLQFPMSVFLITAITIGVWRVLCHTEKIRSFTIFGRNLTVGCLKGFVAFIFLGGFVYLSSGDGLNGSANFNYHAERKGRAFIWASKHTPQDSLFAGHPTHINGLSLFGARKAFVTTEVAHPFYPNYYREVERRLIISFKAHFAKTLEEVLELVEPEGIDYFIFSRLRFYPEALKREKYFTPLDKLVKELAGRDPNDYAYKELPSQVNLAKFPPLVFRDHESAVVDVKALRLYLNEQKNK